MLLLRQRQIPWGSRLMGVCLLILVLFPTQQIYNSDIGWNNAIITTVWFSVLALYLLIKSIERTASGNREFVLLVCALLSGILATYSMGNGLLIWPIMLLVCIRFRDWPWATIVALIGAAIITSYLWDFQRHGLLFDALRQPAELLYFSLIFLGNPTIINLIPPESAAATLTSRFIVTPHYVSLFGALGMLLVIYHFFDRVGGSIASPQPFGSCLAFVYCSSQQPGLLA
jgi:hypothetical protein